ncbi:MAG: Fic family protein, partial [Tannerellaceae bacterium]|nr:Fic family protein [Tannerellaceae bacterium]
MENLTKKIEGLLAEWRSLQPIAPICRERLDQKFMLEFNYNSNHLEGNTLTYGQTELLLLFGETKDSAPLKDYEEMKAHNVGLQRIREEATEKERPLTESFIRLLNKTILVQDYWKDAVTPGGDSTRTQVKVGSYKTRPNSVITATGEKFEYASPEATPALMADLVRWYNKAEKEGNISPLELAALLHYRYIRIHPFEDGNGRIARLLVNFVLHRTGYPMIVIRSDRDSKNEYLRILHQCDVNSGLLPTDGANASPEAIKPFTNYLGNQLVRALETSIKAAKGESIEEPGDFEKRIALLKKEVKKEADIKGPEYSEKQFKEILQELV